MKSYKIYWKDLSKEAKERLKEMYHENIDLTPLAVIDIEEDKIPIELIDTQVIESSEEKHYKIIINNKEVWVNKWYKNNEFGFEGDTEIFKGKELLTEEEEEQVLDFIENELADKGE